MINLHKSMGQAEIQLPTPGSAVRQASAARHVTDESTGLEVSQIQRVKDLILTLKFTATTNILATATPNAWRSDTSSPQGLTPQLKAP